MALSPGEPEPTGNGMTVSLTGLTTATLDLPRMSITVDAPIDVQVVGDGPVTIRRVGPWPDGALVT